MDPRRSELSSPSPSAPHRARALLRASVGAVLGTTLALASGCGATLYTVDVISAESVVAEAEHAGAAELAPYEYYAAREYLTEAHEEASEASYEDAWRYAREAGRLAREARAIAQQRRDQRAADADAPADARADDAQRGSR
jgi:hypothetical protein